MINIILWIMAGAATGLGASYTLRTLYTTSSWKYIVLGVIGAIDGGLTVDLFGLPSFHGFNAASLACAFFMSLALILICRRLQAVYRTQK